MDRQPCRAVRQRRPWRVGRVEQLRRLAAALVDGRGAPADVSTDPLLHEGPQQPARDVVPPDCPTRIMDPAVAWDPHAQPDCNEGRLQKHSVGVTKILAHRMQISPRPSDSHWLVKLQPQVPEIFVADKGKEAVTGTLRPPAEGRGRGRTGNWHSAKKRSPVSATTSTSVGIEPSSNGARPVTRPPSATCTRGTTSASCASACAG